MTYLPKNFTVWAEIPVTDMDKAMSFYQAVLNTELRLNTDGPNPMAEFRTDGDAGVAGHLYPGTPATNGEGPTIHLSVEAPLEDAVERLKTAGGKVLSPPIQIPPGRFVYCQDLDGNSIGLFEAK